MIEPSKRSFRATAETLACQMEAVCGALGLGVPTGRSGTEIRFGRKGSVRVFTQGPSRGRFNDFESGVSGDALDLVRHIHGCSPLDALLWANAFIGSTYAPAGPPPGPPPARPDASDRTEWAMRLWSDGQPIAGSLVETYLNSRGLDLPDPLICEALRYHPGAIWCGPGEERNTSPAMLALMRDPATGAPVGVHRTFLTPCGSKHPVAGKRMLGSAGTICLTPEAEVTAGLGLTEGIETALAVMQRFDFHPVWGTASAGQLARFPVLPGIDGLTVFADHDLSGCGVASAQAVVDRYSAAGADARMFVPPWIGDWADRLPSSEAA